MYTRFSNAACERHTGSVHPGKPRHHQCGDCLDDGRATNRALQQRLTTVGSRSAQTEQQDMCKIERFVHNFSQLLVVLNIQSDASPLHSSSRSSAHWIRMLAIPYAPLLLLLLSLSVPFPCLTYLLFLIAFQKLVRKIIRHCIHGQTC